LLGIELGAAQSPLQSGNWKSSFPLSLVQILSLLAARLFSAHLFYSGQAQLLPFLPAPCSSLVPAIASLVPQ
jgi:hypothetical protein